MSVFASPRFLRHVLVADAVSCLATGAVQLMFAEPLSALLRLPVTLLVGTGIFLLAYAAVVAATAARQEAPRALVWVFVAGNVAWAMGCVALLVGDRITPSLLGQGWMAAQALVVLVLAELQWTALRRSLVARWA